MIKIYSTPTCTWCQKAKRYFKSNKLEYSDIDVSYDQAAAKDMRRISGQTGVPVIIINGTVIIGFDKAAIDKSIGLKNK